LRTNIGCAWSGASSKGWTLQRCTARSRRWRASPDIRRPTRASCWRCGCVQGIGSARELARLCEEHIAFQWLCGGVGMNAKTLADFRVAHGAALEQLLADSFTALLRIGAAKLDRVAQDGVRVRAA